MAMAQEPDRQLLADFLGGRLPGPEHERVAAYLETHPELPALAAVAEADDPLVNIVRRTAEDTPLPDPAAVAALIGRLTRLHPTTTAETADIAGTHPGTPAV